MNEPSQSPTFVGQPVERIEDAALLAGRGRYADDYPVAVGTLHAAIVRSPHAHAEITSIDTADALAQPGVAAVLTGEDIKALSDPFLVVVKQPMDGWSLAVDRVRFVGEPVALVVASDRYKAEDAAALVHVDYRPLKAAVDALEAAAEGAPLLYEKIGSNVVSTREFVYGDPDKAFAEAHRTVSLTVNYPRNSLTPIEAYVVVAEYRPDDDVYDVLANFQGPYTTHPVMARALRVPGSRMRLRTPADSGGSFGVKQGVFPYVVLMAIAARKVGRPVKWVEDRLEHLTAANSAPNRVIALEAAVAEDGKVTALRFDQLDDYGAYLRPPMPGPLYRMHGAMSGAYDIANLAIVNRLVMTNKTPAGLVRGFGGPQMYFALERLMHRIAVELDRDPLEIIQRNLIKADAFPYKAAAGGLYDSGDYQATIEKAVREGALAELKKRRDEARAQGRLYGIGYAAIVEPGMSNLGYLATILSADERRRAGPKDGAVSMVTINVDPLGAVSLTADTMPQGQGHATVLAQIVADELGLTPGDILANLEHDTQKDPWSIAAGTYSCRFSPGTAVAAQIAAKKIRDKMALIAAASLNVRPDKIEFGNGMIFAHGNPDNALKFARVAGTVHWSPGSLPADMEHGLRETGTWSPPQFEATSEADEINTSLTYGFVFDFCGIEIDRETAKVRIDRYVTGHDAGTLLNPLIAEGQILGSFSQGVGAALYEEFVYGEDGSFLTGTFADYLVPSAMEVPEPLIVHTYTPSPFTPLGAKGIAEGCCMSAPACLANAVCDALGIEHIDVPLTPAKLGVFVFGEERAPPGASGTPVPAPRASGHALTGQGEMLVPASPEDVWKTLLDEQKLAAVIPGCRSLDRVGENSYRAELTMGVGPVRGRFKAVVELSELAPPRKLTLSGSLDGPLGASRGGVRVALEPADGGTLLRYDYGAEISGKVAAVGGRMLDGAARILVRQFLDRLVAELGGGAKRRPWWRRVFGTGS